MKKEVANTAHTNRFNSSLYRTQNRAYCPKCQKPVALMALSNTTDLYNTGEKNIYLLIHRGKLHPIHNNRGALMICTDSLFAFFEQGKTQLLDTNYVSNSSPIN